MPAEQSGDRIILKHKGANGEILLCGTTLIYWKTADKSHPEPSEDLSEKPVGGLDDAKFQNKIPALFLSFEDPNHSNNPCLDQLGFVGREIWTNEAGVYVPLTLESTIAPISEPFISYAVHRHLMNHKPKTLLYVDNTSTGASPKILHFRLRLALFRDYTPTTDSYGVKGVVGESDSIRDELIRAFVTKLFDPDYEKKSDSPTFFKESENFSINGGVFNAVGGDILHKTTTVNTGDNNNNTSYINCHCAWSNKYRSRNWLRKYMEKISFLS